MSLPRSLLAGVAVLLWAAAPARAADMVFGGTTKAGEAIVLKGDAKAQRLTSAVIAWRANCADGSYYASSTALTPTQATPGFSPTFRDLMMSRNAKGRFAGTQLAGQSGDGFAAAVSVQLAGKLDAKRAGGTLHAHVDLVDPTTNASLGSCDSGTVRFAAAHAPGTIYGGQTSQENPVVVRVNPNRRTVSDLIAGWDTRTCTPQGAFHIADHFGGFAVKRSGGFGDTWTADYPMDAGGKRSFAYAVAARVTKTTAKGTLHVGITQVDASGAQTLACDSGAITFKALTA
jgi:hypothetical protein